MNSTENTVLGILAGTAIGATLGILFAPNKGEVTRKKIADHATETKENIADTAIQLKDRIATKITTKSDTLENKMEGLVSDVSYKTEDVISTLENKLSQLKAKNKKLQKTS